MTQTSYILISSALSFYIPLIIIVTTYSFIYYLTKKQAANKISAKYQSKRVQHKKSNLVRMAGEVGDAGLKHKKKQNEPDMPHLHKMAEFCRSPIFVVLPLTRSCAHDHSGSCGSSCGSGNSSHSDNESNDNSNQDNVSMDNSHRYRQRNEQALDGSIEIKPDQDNASFEPDDADITLNASEVGNAKIQVKQTKGNHQKNASTNTMLTNKTKNHHHHHHHHHHHQPPKEPVTTKLRFITEGGQSLSPLPQIRQGAGLTPNGLSPEPNVQALSLFPSKRPSVAPQSAGGSNQRLSPMARMRKTVKPKLGSRKSNAVSKQRQRQERKAGQIIVVVILTFLCCWEPFFIVNVTDVICGACVNGVTWTTVAWLGYANSAVNPFIYTAFNKTFRIAIIRVLTPKKS